MIRRLQLVFILWLLLSIYAEGQVYEHAIGVRAGYSSGITYKGFMLHSDGAFEIDAYYNRHGLNLSVLYAYHLEPFRSKQWLVYFGGGVFGGEWENEFSVGLAAVGGIEYIVRDLPVNFSVDWKPLVNVFRVYGIDLLDFGISMRYRFAI